MRPEGAYNNRKHLKIWESSLIQWLVHIVNISSNSEVFDFSGGQKPPIRGLTTIKRSWNYGNLPYLVANTYGLNFIKIESIWIFRSGGGGQKPPIRGLHVSCDMHLRNWPSYTSQKSCVKIWFGLVEPFKSYCVQKYPKKKKKKKITNTTETICFLRAHNNNLLSMNKTFDNCFL